MVNRIDRADDQADELTTLRRRLDAIEESFGRHVHGSGRRNLCINGAMQVHQRGSNGVNVPAPSFVCRTADRWRIDNNITAVADSACYDYYEGMFYGVKALLIQVAQKAVLLPGDYFIIRHYFEGQDVQSIRKGLANAQPLTVSFWVNNSYKAGTYIVELEDTANGRTCSASYTCSAGVGNEYKTVTFPADTTGVLPGNSSGGSLSLNFWFAAGTNFNTGNIANLQRAWGAPTQANRAAGCSNEGSGAANQFQITYVQMEVGSVATPFEHRAYGEELAQCQRYFRRTQQALSGEGSIYGYNLAGAAIGHTVCFPVQMRVPPTVSVGGAWVFLNTASLNTQSPTLDGVLYYIVSSAAGYTYAYSNNSGFVDFNAEI